MHHFQDTRQLPYTAQQLFNLVIDIERYPEFLPWCRAARILERSESRIIGELIIHFKHITESYVSEVTFKRPEEAKENGFIDVKLIRGPFEKLENHWQFRAIDEKNTEIALDLSFKFRSRILDSLIGLLFGKASIKMVNAFEKRANDLYGKIG